MLDPAFQIAQSGSSFPSSARMIQKALTAMHATLTAMQNSLQAMTGQDGEKALAIPPLDGPQNVDAATADFANRLACIMRITVRQSPEMGKAFHEALAAARKSFRYLDSSDPRNLVFPLQFVLATGTLLAETGLRGLVSYEAVGAQHFPKFCADILEIFTDNQLMQTWSIRTYWRSMRPGWPAPQTTMNCASNLAILKLSADYTSRRPLICCRPPATRPCVKGPCMMRRWLSSAPEDWKKQPERRAAL